MTSTAQWKTTVSPSYLSCTGHSLRRKNHTTIIYTTIIVIIPDSEYMLLDAEYMFLGSKYRLPDEG